MGLLIDASVLIDHERGRIEIEEQLRQRQDEEFFLSVITASELLHGVHRASDPGICSRRSAWVEAILERFPILPVDLPTARAHAQLGAHLTQQGRLIGPHDLWLAAVCLAHGYTLVTGNLREFERVPGLDVESWRR